MSFIIHTYADGDLNLGIEQIESSTAGAGELQVRKAMNGQFSTFIKKYDSTEDMIIKNYSFIINAADLNSVVTQLLKDMGRELTFTDSNSRDFKGYLSDDVFTVTDINRWQSQVDLQIRVIET